MCFGPSVYLLKGGKSCPTQETNLLMLEMGYIRVHCNFALCSPFACYSLCLVPWASHTLCCCQMSSLDLHMLAVVTLLGLMDFCFRGAHVL